MTKALAKTLLKYTIGLGLLAWVIANNWQSSDAGPGLREALARPIRFLSFAVAGLFIGLSALVTFVRWYLLVRAQELPFTLVGALRLGAVGYFFNTFLPGSVGGDLVKALGLARAQSRRTVAVANARERAAVRRQQIRILVTRVAVIELAGVEIENRRERGDEEHVGVVARDFDVRRGHQGAQIGFGRA